jgi:hypothetical protein
MQMGPKEEQWAGSQIAFAEETVWFPIGAMAERLWQQRHEETAVTEQAARKSAAVSYYPSETYF